MKGIGFGDIVYYIKAVGGGSETLLRNLAKKATEMADAIKAKKLSDDDFVTGMSECADMLEKAAASATETGEGEQKSKTKKEDDDAVKKIQEAIKSATEKVAAVVSRLKTGVAATEQDLTEITAAKDLLAGMTKDGDSGTVGALDAALKALTESLKGEKKEEKKPDDAKEEKKEETKKTDAKVAWPVDMADSLNKAAKKS